MQRWFLTFGFAGVLAGSVCAQQVEIQVQVQAGQAQVLPIQAQGGPAQIQVLPFQPGQMQATRVMLPPIQAQQTKLTQADAILVGRVVAIEPMDVEAAPAPGQANVKYRIAVVQVSESIYGLKKGTENVRVAFLAQPNNGLLPPGAGFVPPNGGAVQIQPAIVQPGGGPMLRRPFPVQMNLTVGQDGMFALNKHHKENFYLAPNYATFISRENNPAFEGEVKTAKKLAKVMGDPVAALKAEDKDDRYSAAAVLISKYRNVNNPTGAAMKQEPIDADESKLILKAIAGADWTSNRFNAAIPSPFELFNQLGINQKDGYNPVNLRTQQDVVQAMQKWLDENSDKYRVSRQVVDPNAKAPAPLPGVQPGQPGVIRPGLRPLPPVQIQPLPAPVPVPPAQQE
jgi:hypothetical protein